MNAIRNPTTLRPVALTLDAMAALTIVAVGAYAVFLKVSFEPTSANLYRSRIGSHLLTFIALAAAILVIGVAVSRPALLGPNAYVVGVGVAFIAVGLSVFAVAHANSQLHPPLTAERAALAQFVPPQGVIDQSTTFEVSAAPVVTRHWDISGQVSTVCAAARASLEAWADQGTLQTTPEPATECGFAARKGADTVTLLGIVYPGQNIVNLTLTLTHKT